MINKKAEKDLVDYVLKLLDHPELEQTDEFRQWIKVRKHRRFYEDARAARDALALTECSLPDLKQEWELLQKSMATRPLPASPSSPLSPDTLCGQSKRKPLSLYTLLYRGRQIAAILLLLAGIGLTLYHFAHPSNRSTESFALMETDRLPQEVVLSTNTGHKVVLTANPDKDSLAHLGTSLRKDRKLYYPRSTSQSDQQQAATIHTLTTPRGKGFKFILPDGSEVWLNAESSLRYPSAFADAQRVVELTGEAFFQVAHNANQPFIVKTGGIEAEVLGTRFNLRNYAHSSPHITLVDGKVLVTAHQTSVTLRPGEDASIDREGNIRIAQVDTRTYTAWTDGYFYFGDVPLSDIMRELGRWYNLTIVFNDRRAMDYRFNFWARRTDAVEDVLALINQMGKVKVTMKENALIIG